MVVGRINGVVALMGFSYEEMYGCFAGTKKSGRNNEVVVRRTVSIRSIMQQKRTSRLQITSFLQLRV